MRYEITVTYEIEADNVKEALDNSKLDVDADNVLALSVEITEAEG